MNAITAWNWQTLATWPVIQQWIFIIVLSGLLLLSGYGLLLYPNWQSYQQLICQTNALIESNTSKPLLFETAHQRPLLLKPLQCESHLSLVLT